MSEDRARTAFHAQLLDIEQQHRAALETERHILHAARDRLAIVQSRLTGLYAQVLLDDAKARLYQALILERGQLQQTIALAEQALQPRRS